MFLLDNIFAQHPATCQFHCVLPLEQCGLLIQVDVEVEASGVAVGVTGVVVEADVVVVTSSPR